MDPMHAQHSPLYTVEFDAREVWGEPALTGRICADVFEYYLEAAG